LAGNRRYEGECVGGGGDGGGGGGGGVLMAVRLMMVTMMTMMVLKRLTRATVLATKKWRAVPLGTRGRPGACFEYNLHIC
jgi:hypothetical protein